MDTNAQRIDELNKAIKAHGFGSTILEFKKGTPMEEVESILKGLIGELEDRVERPLQDKEQQNMRDLLLKRGNEINDKVHFWTEMLEAIAELIDLINEDHVEADGMAFHRNRMKQVQAVTKLIKFLDKKPEAAAQGNGSASR